jgi:hypothetical protein
LTMGQREGSVVSIPEPNAQPRLTDWLDGFGRKRGYRPHPSDGQNELIPDAHLDIRSVAGEQGPSQKSEIELPDMDGFFAGLIPRLVRGRNRLGLCGMESQFPIGRRSIGRTTATRRLSPGKIETAGLNRKADPLGELSFVELAHRQAQAFLAKEGIS